MVLLVTAVVGGGAGLMWSHQRAAAEREVEVALDDAERLQEEGKWPEALLAARRAEPLLAAGLVKDSLRERVRERLADLKMIARLDDIFLQMNVLNQGKVDFAAADPNYEKAFQDYGIDVLRLGPAAAAERIRTKAISKDLAAALQHWAIVCREWRRHGDAAWKELLATARAADPDEARNRLRDALTAMDRKSLVELAASEHGATLPPSGLIVLANALVKTGARAEAVALLRQAQRRLPGDFWINDNLAYFLEPQSGQERPGTYSESIRFYTVALALRPYSPHAHFNLGRVLQREGRLEEAEAEFRQASTLDSKFAKPLIYLGCLLQRQGRLQEAELEFRKAIEIKPDYAEAYFNLGNALRDQKKLVEAVAAYRKATELKSDFAGAHVNLGNALRDQKKPAEAVAAYRKAIELKPDFADAYSNLGCALFDQKKLAEAEAACRKAIELQPNNGLAYSNLGAAMSYQQKWPEAVAAYRKAVELRPDQAEAHNNLGVALRRQKKLPEAETASRKAIELKPDYADAYCNLGHALIGQGQFAEGLVALKRGHGLGSANPGWRYSSAEWVRAAEQLVALDAKLSKVLNGEAQPAGAGERIALAHMCQRYKTQYATAARFFAAAFAEQPRLAGDLNQQHRYNAACAAALAGCGQGADADKLCEKERARLRQQALDWLHADLKVYRRELEKAADKVRGAVAQRMQHWLQDTDFAGVRGADALARLPEGERQQWHDLWQEVEALRRHRQDSGRPKRRWALKRG